jgi:hypothetical protein
MQTTVSGVLCGLHRTINSGIISDKSITYSLSCVHTHSSNPAIAGSMSEKLLDLLLLCIESPLRTQTDDLRNPFLSVEE